MKGGKGKLKPSAKRKAGGTPTKPKPAISSGASAVYLEKNMQEVRQSPSASPVKKKPPIFLLNDQNDQGVSKKPPNNGTKSISYINEQDTSQSPKNTDNLQSKAMDGSNQTENGKNAKKIKTTEEVKVNQKEEGKEIEGKEEEGGNMIMEEKQGLGVWDGSWEELERGGREFVMDNETMQEINSL